MPLSLHLIRHLRLAVPVMMARAGLIAMISIDSIMAGQAGAVHLAHYAIGLAPHITLLVLGIGLLVGTIVLIAQTDGAGRPEDCGPIWSTAIRIGGVLGLATGLLLLGGETLLLWLGQSEELARGGGRVLSMFAAGMPAIAMYIATTFFLEGIGRPKAGMMIALAANLLNAGLNWVLIYGNMGAPELGAAGAALATTITRWAMLAALLAYTVKMPGSDLYGVRKAPPDRWFIVRRLLRIGAPLSVAAGLETTSFSLVLVFAGRLGEIPLASYQIALNVVTFVFMLAIGLSTATSVRVANAVGRADRQGMVMAGWTGVGLTCCLMMAVGAGVLILNRDIARLYTSDVAVLDLAAPALVIASFIILVDGAQAVLLGALRGVGDVILPTLIYAVSFWVIATPLAYTFGLKGQAGVAGLLWALFAGLSLAFILLAVRFHLVARRGSWPA